MTPTFKNLKFRPKKYDKKCIGASLEVKDGVFVSVVAGPGLYSTPGGSISQTKREAMPDYPDSNDFSSFEVAVIDENEPDEFQEWQVKGWQTRENINQIIRETIKNYE